MRLIDADDFIKKFMRGDADTEEEKTMIGAVRRMIKDQPTAYDPNKVVEILSCWREEQHKNADELRAEYSNSDVKIVIVNEVMKLVDDIIDDIIEAVRKGGV